MRISKTIQAYCSFKRFRYSPGRELVADMLQSMNRNATGDEIWMELSRTGYRISESAVFVHLRWLMENGFAGRCRGEGRQAEYYLINKQPFPGHTG